MSNHRLLRPIGFSLLVFGLSGCSTIKSWFPDKEKDYQFTSEIPELIVPDDLKNKGLMSVDTTPSARSEPESQADAGTSEESLNQMAQTTSVASETIVSETERQDDVVKAAHQPDSGIGAAASSLQIDQAKTPATRMVGRALSRKQMEIVERNIDKGYFYVKFDPNAVEAKDENLWDEIVFMFGDDPSNEQEYRITVHQIAEQMSEVTIQDDSGKTISNTAANALLKLITDGINEVVNQETESAPADASEQDAPENTDTSN